MNNNIKNAVDVAQRAQRNYYLSKSVSDQDLETLNKDVPEKFRTGSPEEYWHFPSFKKYTKVTINGS
jgi:hypothetical protein